MQGGARVERKPVVGDDINPALRVVQMIKRSCRRSKDGSRSNPERILPMNEGKSGSRPLGDELFLADSRALSEHPC